MDGTFFCVACKTPVEAAEALHAVAPREGEGGWSLTRGFPEWYDRYRGHSFCSMSCARAYAACHPIACGYFSPLLWEDAA